MKAYASTLERLKTVGTREHLHFTKAVAALQEADDFTETVSGASAALRKLVDDPHLFSARRCAVAGSRAPGLMAALGYAPTAEPDALANAVWSLPTTSPARPLLRVVVQNLLREPTNPKFKSIKRSGTAGRKLSEPGAMAVLALLGFRPRDDALVADDARDDALVADDVRNAAAAARALSTAPTYEFQGPRTPVVLRRLELAAKALDAFAAEEPARRAAKAFERLPPEPTVGAAGTTTITFLPGPKRRRFDADDTFGRVMEWVRVCAAEPRASLEDVDLVHPRRALSPGDAAKTLQALQLWPSAALRLKAKDQATARPPAPAKLATGGKPKPSDLFRRVKHRFDAKAGA